MKKVFIIILCILLFSFSGQDVQEVHAAEAVQTVVDRLVFQLGEEDIHLWAQEDSCYLFVPSYAEIEQMNIAADLGEYQMEIGGVISHAGDFLLGVTVGKAYPAAIYDEKGELVCFFTLHIMQSAGLPTLYIETASGTMTNIQADQEYEEAATMSLYDAGGAAVFADAIDYIEGRGNNSWDRYEKKPYQLRLKEDAELLNMGAARKWLLIANASDDTLLRNAITRQMAAELEMPQSEDGQFVDLYLNGEYAGNYYLCEKVEVGENRLNITDLEQATIDCNKGDDLSIFDVYEDETKKARIIPNNPEDITGGYLIEREFEGRFQAQYEEYGSSFLTEDGEHFEVSSPEYCSVEQITYIQNLVQEAEKAILAEDGINADTGKAYTEYIDVDSFVKKYLIEEVSMNYDGGVTSSYFYKDSDSVSSLLYAGPAWDYDVTFGNYVNWLGVTQINPRSLTRLSSHQDATSWFYALCQKEAFQELVKVYYAESISPLLERWIGGELDATKESIQASADMDYARWKRAYQVNSYYAEREDSYRWLKTFISERKDFLDEVYLEGVEYHSVKLMIEDAIYDTLYIRDGEQLGELPLVSGENRVFTSWTLEDSGIEPHSYMPVYEDMMINANFSEVVSPEELDEKAAELNPTITYVPEEFTAREKWMLAAVILLYALAIAGIVMHAAKRKKKHGMQTEKRDVQEEKQYVQEGKQHVQEKRQQVRQRKQKRGKRIR